MGMFIFQNDEETEVTKQRNFCAKKARLSQDSEKDINSLLW